MKNDKSIENQTDQLTPANKPEELTTYLTSNVIGCVNNRMTDWPFYQYWLLQILITTKQMTLTNLPTQLTEWQTVQIY